MESGVGDGRDAMTLTRSILSLICGLAGAGLAIGVAVERHASAALERGNAAMRQQLGQMDLVAAENLRLSNLVAQVNSSSSRPKEPLEAQSTGDERVRELARLRDEVQTLRQQSKEIEALREDTRQVHAAQQNGLRMSNAGRAGKAGSGSTANGSQLEILKAEYWTANTNMDVAAELSERIRGDGLKAVASNNIKGDPEFGQVKRLTVVYRVGGVTRTNEYREGDLVILPGD